MTDGKREKKAMRENLAYKQKRSRKTKEIKKENSN